MLELSRSCSLGKVRVKLRTRPTVCVLILALIRVARSVIQCNLSCVRFSRVPKVILRARLMQKLLSLLCKLIGFRCTGNKVL